MKTVKEASAVCPSFLDGVVIFLYCIRPELNDTTSYQGMETDSNRKIYLIPVFVLVKETNILILSQLHLNHNTASTSTLVGVHIKMMLQNTPPPTKTQS